MASRIDVPKDTYNVLKVTLPSQRVMTVLIPADITAQDATRVSAELRELADITAAWKPS